MIHDHPDVTMVCPTCGTSPGVRGEIVVITNGHGERYEIVPCPECGGR